MNPVASLIIHTLVAYFLVLGAIIGGTRLLTFLFGIHWIFSILPILFVCFLFTNWFIPK